MEEYLESLHHVTCVGISRELCIAIRIQVYIHTRKVCVTCISRCKQPHLVVKTEYPFFSLHNFVIIQFDYSYLGLTTFSRYNHYEKEALP